jgi:serine/threonine protein kinase
MSDTSQQRVQQLFRQAIRLKPEDRENFLDAECKDDPSGARQQVEELLAQEKPDGLLGMAWSEEAGPTKTVESAAAIPAPEHQRIGPYRILEMIGKGGMGEVYHAKQEKPVRRKVALKIIKRGMDTDQVIARFEAERQALAMMNHPNVAKVFDAGATERGRPYFAMEYVQGVPITEFCDRHRLTTKERLELFMQVCEGVQHAHQNAIIHRDIKPSNVLVTVQNGRRVAKIIDFGVAKATAQRLTERTLFTELGQLIGTPEYMSPEQAEMTAENVDTRTDVYSLGVLLYELMVGALPFDSRELRQAGFDEIRRKIREEEPSKPSTRIGTLGDVATDSARHRRTDPASLARQLRGDLDWITMKALEKDRTRRHGSPNELAADIQHHLKHEPVSAGPPSAAYRMGKFVRRHRVGVTSSMVVLVALIGVAITMTIQAGRIASERDRANQEARTARQVSDFLAEMFEVSKPEQSRGDTITARDILERGRDRIDELEDQPVVQARLMYIMGTVYSSLALYPQAESLLEQALKIRRRVLGDDDPDTLSAANSLAGNVYFQGRVDQAKQLWLEALEGRRRVLGDDHPDTLESTLNVGNAYFGQGQYDEAEARWLETLDFWRRAPGEDRSAAGKPMRNLAILYQMQGRYNEAEALELEALELWRRTLGEDHPLTLGCMMGLAILYGDLGRDDEAEALHLETLELRRRVQGEDHPYTLISMDFLARFYYGRDRHDESEPLYLETLDARRRVLGNDDPATIDSMRNLALDYLSQGRYDEAEPLYVEALETRRRVLGEDHRDTLESMGNLGCLAALRGDRATALEWLRRAVDRGWGDADFMTEHDHLESLHGDPEFEAIVDEVKKRIGSE